MTLMHTLRTLLASILFAISIPAQTPPFEVTYITNACTGSQCDGSTSAWADWYLVDIANMAVRTGVYNLPGFLDLAIMVYSEQTVNCPGAQPFAPYDCGALFVNTDPGYLIMTQIALPSGSYSLVAPDLTFQTGSVPAMYGNALTFYVDAVCWSDYFDAWFYLSTIARVKVWGF